MPPAVAIGAAIAGAAIASSAAVVAVVGTVGAAIVGAVVSTGINILGNKLLGTNKVSQSGAQKDPGVMVNVQDNVASIPIVYGRRRIAGRQIYVATSGTSNRFLHLVYAVAEGEIQEIERIVFGDDEIVFDGIINPMTATSGSLPSSAARGRFKNFISVEWRLGTTTQTAFTDLVTSTQRQEGKWTTDHRGLGVALVHLKVLYDKDKMNQIPTVYFDIKGKKCRTYGGSFVYSDNPADVLLDYLTNTTYGKGLNINDIDQTSYNEVKNYCNQVITLYTDISAVTGKRYLCNGYLNPDEPVFDNIKNILSSFNGYLLWGAGKYKFKVFKEEVNTGFTFDESNIIGEISMQLGSKEILANRVKAHFYNSGIDFAEDIAIYEDTDLKDREDNGEWLEKEIALPMVSDYTRALMLAKQALQQSRRSTVISFQAAPNALEVEVGDRVWFSHPYLGFQDDYRVTGMVLNPDKTVSVTLVQYDDNIYSLADIQTAPGPTSQGRNTRINGLYEIRPLINAFNCKWFRFCPGAVDGIDNGYGLYVPPVVNGYIGYQEKQFVQADVSVDNNTITIPAHGFPDFVRVTYSYGGVNPMPDLTQFGNYYVIVIDSNTIKLATSEANARAGINIDFTSTAVGTGNLDYQGSPTPFDAVDYYQFIVTTNTETRIFTSPSSTVVMPEAAWPSGTLQRITTTAYSSYGGTMGISVVNEDPGELELQLNSDPATFCPYRRPQPTALFQICDGSSGVSAGNIMNTWPENTGAITGNAKKYMAGPGTSKWKIRWTGGPDTKWFTKYRVSLTLAYDGSTFYTGTTAVVNKTTGATPDTIEEHTFANIATMPTFFPFDSSKDVVVVANVVGIDDQDRESVTLVGGVPELTANPTAGEDCYFGGPVEVRYYQVCNGTGGTDPAGTGTGKPKLINGRYTRDQYGNPTTTLNTSRAQRAPQDVDAYVGFYIVHNTGGDKSFTDAYEVEFAVYKDDGTGNPGTTPTATITQTFTYDGTTFVDAQYNVVNTVVDFNHTGDVWVDLRCRAKRTVAGTPYYSQWKYMANGLSGDLQNATAPPAGESCF